MIRPLTIATFLLACGSGLYLYQSKHEVQVLDRTIEKTVHETTALREQSRLLSAEWTMLNDPERLRQFSDTYLHVKSINPAQFTSLADLNTKLPPVQIPAPVPAAEEEVPVASQEPPQPVAEPEAAPAAVADDVLPVPPVPSAPAQKASVASVPRQPEVKLAVTRPAAPEVQSRTVVAGETHPAEQRIAAPKMASIVAPQRQTQSPTQVPVQAQASVPAPRPIVLAAPRPVPANTPAYRPYAHQVSANQVPSNPSPVAYPRPVSAQPTMAPAPYGGSLLGMARGSMPPAPRPTPVNATYNTN